MGQLVVAIAGGVVGSLFGMPQLGFLAGSLLGMALFPQKSSGGGGRLTDLKVTSSTYGMPIPRLWGTVRIGGNIIYAQDIQEHKEHHHVGKGGQSQTTYSYSWAGAVGLCVGPITDVVKIWADTKLVYDKTGASSNTFNKYKLKFRLYKGTETQIPDPIANFLFGAANAQAHRGMAYIVFDNIPLLDYGNRVPNFTFEVVVNGVSQVAQTGYGFTYPTNVTVGETHAGIALIDWDRNRSFFLREGRESGLGAVADAGIHAIRIDTGAQYFEQNITNVVGAGSMRWINTLDGGAACLGKDGFIYFASEVGNSCAFEKVDPDSLVTTGHFGTANNTFDNGPNSIVSPHAITSVQIPSSVATFIVSGSRYGGGGVGGTVTGFCGDTMLFSGFSFIIDEFQAIPVAGPQDADAVTAICIGKAHYLGFNETTPIGIYRLVISDGAQGFDPATWPDEMNGAVSFSKSGTFTYTDVDPTSNGFIDVMGPAYDPSDGNVLVQCLMHYSVGSNKTFMVKVDSSDGHVIWSTQTGGANNSLETSINGDMAMSQSRILNGQYAFVRGGNGGATHATVYVLNTADGALTTEDWTPDLLQRLFSQQHWDEERGAIILAGSDTHLANGTSAKWIIIYPGRATGAGVTLGQIVSDICGMVTLEPSDIDVTDLPEIVPGYLMAQQMTAKDAIAPLALVYFFDGFESDFIMKFIHRGHAGVFTIPASDLARIETQKNSLVQITRVQEVDLPVQVSLTFFDPNHDFQAATAYTKRPFTPAPTMYSKNVMSEDVPIVLNPIDAKAACERALYAAWINRVQYKVKLPWQYLRYDPTDVGVLHPDTQTSVSVRLASTDVGVNYSIDTQAVSESGESYDNTTQPVDSYTSNAVAYGGEGFVPQQIKVPGATKFIPMDTPLLQDIDDTGFNFTLLYYAGGGYDSNWPGMELWKSADQASYVDVGGVTRPAAWGSTVNALGDTADVFALDDVNTLTVAMTQGGTNLASVTFLQMCNGSNGAVLLKSNGEVEVIQFQDVAQNADGTYTLSNLLRGRRGTDTMATGHTSGETFVLLTPSNGVSNAQLSLGELSLLRYYKSVTRGSLLENAPITPFTATGRPLFPYAPVQVAATLSGSDIDITWTRRTRIHGAWNDNTGVVPLAETTEAYDILIYDAPGTTLLRALSVDFGATPVAFPDIVYTAADIAIDFGSTPSDLTVAIYQKSSAIGRGSAYKVTVPVV